MPVANKLLTSDDVRDNKNVHNMGTNLNNLWIKIHSWTGHLSENIFFK